MKYTSKRSKQSVDNTACKIKMILKKLFNFTDIEPRLLNFSECNSLENFFFSRFIKRFDSKNTPE